MAWAFDPEVNQGNTLTLLEMLEEFYRANYSYIVNLARYVGWPLLTITMAMLIGFIVYAMFSPWVALVQHMASQVMP